MRRPKLNIEFISDYALSDEIISNAMLTQLMVTITMIGLRVDNNKSINGIILKEIEHGKEK
jgi:hypothetical protein